MDKEAASSPLSFFTYLKNKYGGKKRIVLLGNYGITNLGDIAILTVLLDTLGKTHPDSKIFIPSYQPSEIKSSFNMPSASFFSAATVFGLLNSDFIILSGGMFGKHASRKSPLLINVLSILQKLGKKIIFYNVGIYRDCTRCDLNKLFRLMEGIDTIVLREDSDLSAIPESIIKKSFVAPDVTYQIEIPKSKNSGKIGIILRFWDWHNTEAITAIIKRLFKESKKQFVLYAFSLDEKNLLEKFFKENLDPERITVFYDLDPKKTIKSMSTLAAAVTRPYHSIVFAHALGVPQIVMPYDRKCENLVRIHDLESVDLNEKTYHKLKSFIEKNSG